MDSSYQELKSVNTELTLFLFGEEGLVHSNHSRKIYWLNALGVFIWLNLEEGKSRDEILSACSSQGITHTEELYALIDELSELFSKSELMDKESQEDSIHEHWLDKISFNANKGMSSDYKILDIGFQFQFPDKSIENMFQAILEQFRISTDESLRENKKIQIGILDKNAGLYQIEINHFLFSWEIPRSRLLSFLLDRIRKLAFSFSEYHLAIHAAVLAKDDQCIVFPAMSYSGKSTLAASLLKNNYQYLSDEIAVLDEQFYVRPLPLGLGLKQGSWSVLDEFLPELGETEPLERWDGVPMKYLGVWYQEGMDALALSQERKEVSSLIFPCYTKDAVANLSSISAPSALHELFQAGYTEGRSLCLESCRALIHWLNHIPKFKFVYDDLNLARECLAKT